MVGFHSYFNGRYPALCNVSSGSILGSQSCKTRESRYSTTVFVVLISVTTLEMNGRTSDDTDSLN